MIFFVANFQQDVRLTVEWRNESQSNITPMILAVKSLKKVKNDSISCR